MQSFTEIVDRTKALFNIRNDVDLAKMLGFSRQAWSNRKKLASIPYDEIIELSSKHNIDINWLFTGKGTQNKDDSSKIDDNKYLNVYEDVELSMGHGSFFDNEHVTNKYVFDKKFLQSLNPTKMENLVIVGTKGDSMRPTIQAPEFIMLDRGINNWQGEGIYALALDDVMMLKRLQKVDKKYKVISDNKEYDPFYIDNTTSFNVIGKLVMILRKFYT